MESKHSIEKQTAHYVDCFTTVSEITNNECKELLDKPADVILMNGFEDDFVPKGATFTGKRKRARAVMLRVANSLWGRSSMMIRSSSEQAGATNSRIKASMCSWNH